MTTVTENDLKKLEEKIDKLTEMVTQLTIGQAKIDERLNGIDKRLDNLEGINRAAVAGVFISLFGVIATATAKFLFFPDV